MPVYAASIQRANHRANQIQSLTFSSGETLPLEALFTTRGDLFHNQLAKMLGAKILHGEIVVDSSSRTTVAGLYAAGCVTPANCQMIIAAGQGAAAGQAMNATLFKRSLAMHSLRNVRRA